MYPQSLLPVNNAMKRVHLTEWALAPDRKWLVTLITIIPLFHQCWYFVKSVLLVAHKVHNLVRIKIPFFLWCYAQHLPLPLKLSNSDEASR